MRSTSLRTLQNLTLTALCWFAAHAASAAIVVWNGTNGVTATTNWSDFLNWTGTGATPTSSDTAAFFDNGAGGVAVGTVNNVVDTAFTVKAVQYGNTNGNHTTLILPNQTLTVNGGLTAGTETDQGNTQTLSATITGAGGTLTVNNTSSNLVVRQGSTSAANAGSMKSTLDVSGLDNFNATVSQVRLGASGPFSRPSGTLYLAKSNMITASGSAPAIQLGGDGASPGNAGNGSFMYLGISNVIFANSMTTARTKQGGCSILFNPAFTNAGNAFVQIRGTAGGVTRMTNWAIGDSGTSSGTVTTTGTNDFTGGTVDAMADVLTVAHTSQGAGTGNPSGTLTFSSGTFDINTLQIGMAGNTTNNQTVATGTVNVRGTARMLVNTTMDMGHIAAGTNGTKGTLNLNGGTANVNTIVCGYGTNNINLNSGTLVVTNTLGTATLGMANFATTNSTLGLAALAVSSVPITSAYVTNLTTGGTTNVVNILSIPVLTGYPAQFPLIKYVGTIGGTGFDFGLGTLPATSPAFVGYLSNNVANHSVDLVLTFGPAPARFITWTGVPSGDWDILNNTNWKTNGVATSFNGSDFVIFDDSAPGATTVNLTTGLAPSSVNMTNNTQTYTFVGNYLTGPTGLNKQGSGTLIIDTTGNNNFTGPVTIGGGTLQIGNQDLNGNIPAGVSVTDNGTLTFSVANGTTVSNVISGAGGIVENGGSVLTLAGANSFTGAVSVVSGSTLVLANTSALGATNMGTVIDNGATLDVGGFAAANVASIGAEQVTVSGNGASSANGTGAIINSSGVAQQNLLRYVILAGNTTFGGSSRWDIRGSNIHDPSTAGLSTGGVAYNLTKVGNSQVSLTGVTVDPALGDVDVQGGTLSLEEATTGLGNPGNTLTIESGATLQFFSLTNLLNKNISLADGTYVTNASGANTVVGPMTLNGGVTFVAGGTSLTLNNTITGSGSISKLGTNLLVLGGTASPGGGTSASQGTLAVNGTLSGTVTMFGGSTLTGTGTASGAVDIQGGANLNPGSVNGAGTLTTSGGLTLDGGANLVFDLSPTNFANGGVNDFLNVGGSFSVGGVSFNVNLLQPQARMQTGSYHLISYPGATVPVFSGVSAVQPSRYTFTLDTSTAHQVNLNVAGNPLNITWNSTTDTNWDVNTSFNWFDPVGGTNTIFLSGDAVLFDDTASVMTNIYVGTNVAVLPGTITNNSTANNFTIFGPGKISGTSSIVKNGGSTLTLATTNDFSGTVTVLGGTLKIASTNALGTTNGSTTIASTATLDVNGFNLASEPVIVSGAGVGGNGAVVNNSTNMQQNALLNVALAGDTTFGGLSRWDIRGNGNTDSATNAALLTGGQAYNLTKTGTNYVALVGVFLDPALANIVVKQGLLSIEHATTLGNPTNSLTVSNGATLQFWALPPTNVPLKQFVLFGDGVTASVTNGSGTNVVGGPFTLNGNCVIAAGGTSLNLTNVISGTGNLVKTGTNNLILSTSNAYTGTTLVSAGTLSLSGLQGAVSTSPVITVSAGATLDASVRADATLTLAANQTLYGNGTVGGKLIVGSGATVAPGAATNTVGTLTVAGGVTLSGTTRMDIDLINHTNDLLRSTSATLTYGGALVLNISGTPAQGDSYTLFSAANYAPSPAFTSITPATPGAGLAWDTSTLTANGKLNVVTGVVNPPTIGQIIVNGTALSITGSGGPHSTGYRVLTSTNVAALRSTWTQIGTGSFDGSGNFGFNGSITPSDKQRYYLIVTP